MKKIIISLFILFSFFLFDENVLADASITCEGGGITCTFVMGSSAQSNGKCVDNSNKSYDLLNYNGILPSKRMLNEVTNNYNYTIPSSNAKCPAYMLVSSNTKQIVFLGNDQYKVPCVMKSDTCENPDALVSGSMKEVAEYISYAYSELNGSNANFNVVQPKMTNSEIGEDCDTQLNLENNKMTNAQSKVKNANCTFDIESEKCKQLYKEWQDAINNAKQVSSDLLQKKICSKSEIDTFNKRIKEHEKEYAISKHIDNKDDPADKPNITIGPLSCETLSKLTNYVGKIYTWVEIFTVVGFVILTMFDYTKAITSSDEDKIKKSNKRVVTRVIILLIVILLPTLLNLVFRIFVPNIKTCLNL